MGEKDENQQADPFERMLQFYDDWTKTWAGRASEMVSSKPFADSLAQQLETALSTTQMLRRQMGEIMEHSLQQMSLPTRKEVISIAERLTHVEMRLDDMEAKLDEALDLLKARRVRKA